MPEEAPAHTFERGDLIRRKSDGKRGIFLKDDPGGQEGKSFIQVKEKAILEPIDEWALMRKGWGVGLKTEEERKAALKGT